MILPSYFTSFSLFNLVQSAVVQGVHMTQRVYNRSREHVTEHFHYTVAALCSIIPGFIHNGTDLVSHGIILQRIQF